IREKRAISFLLAFFFCLIIVTISSGVLGNGHLELHLWQLNLIGFSWKHFFHLLVQVAGRHPFLLMAVILTLSQHQERLWRWYLFLALVALATSGKIGSEENYYLELIALGSIGSGFLIGRISCQIGYLISLAQLFLYLPLQPAAVFNRTYGQEVPAAVSGIIPGQSQREVGELICAYLKPLSEPVISEDPGYLLLVGKKIFLQPYQYTQLVKAGRWDEKPLLKLVEEKRFSSILVGKESFEGKSVYFTSRFLTSVRNNYLISRIIGNYYLLEPVP
ncbi:MAG: hypothetical protein NC911_10650, partial [Candidatus Omnitrophica bacterium]|nr:hypothetical protein [Candidatus Omnitrophota bacterium]